MAIPSMKRIAVVTAITAGILAVIYRNDDLRDAILDDGSWWPF